MLSDIEYECQCKSTDWQESRDADQHLSDNYAVLVGKRPNRFCLLK